MGVTRRSDTDSSRASRRSSVRWWSRATRDSRRVAGPQHVGGDERVAVAIAADPRAHAHGTGGVDADRPAVGDEPFEVALQRRDDAEQARLVVAQGLVDLVGDAQLRHAQHGRLPQREHEHAQVVVELGAVGRARRRVGAGGEHPGDLADDVEHGLAAHLGRVGGDDRHDEQVGDEGADAVGIDARGDEVVERRLDAADLRARPVGAVEAPAPLVVHVLGRVGEQRQPAERPDEVQLVVDRPAAGASRPARRAGCARRAGRRRRAGGRPRRARTPRRRPAPARRRRAAARGGGCPR